MTYPKKIYTTLAVATAVLLEACSSTSAETTGAPAAVVNVKATELVGSWETGSIATSLSGASTVTGASGGGGTGSISAGEAYQLKAVFSQDGHIDFTLESYATSNCNTITLSSSGAYSAVYFIGGASTANDGSPATEYRYSDSSSTAYSIFQPVNGTRLYQGDENYSSPGHNGDSQATRIDGLGVEMLKNYKY